MYRKPNSNRGDRVGLRATDIGPRLDLHGRAQQLCMRKSRHTGRGSKPTGLRNSAAAPSASRRIALRWVGFPSRHVRPRPWRGYTASGGRARAAPPSPGAACHHAQATPMPALALGDFLGAYTDDHEPLSTMAFVNALPPSPTGGRAGLPRRQLRPRLRRGHGVRERANTRVSTSPGWVPGRTRRRPKATLLDLPVSVLAGAIAKLLLPYLLCIDGSFPRRR